MFTVGEFSQLAQVSKRLLRYYDEIGLLKPIVAKTVYNHNIDSILALTYACHRLGKPQPGELGGRLDYDQPFSELTRQLHN